MPEAYSAVTPGGQKIHGGRSGRLRSSGVRPPVRGAGHPER